MPKTDVGSATKSYDRSGHRKHIYFFI